MKKRFRIVFMGTPDFAVPALKAIHEAGHFILRVATQPDRPKGRGLKHQASPVKKAAMDLGLTVVQPNSVKDPAFIRAMKDPEPDLFVVTAFGQILPPELLKIPKSGAVNIHASLLPKLRGPAPIQWAIINGEKETGVTTMLMNPGLDTGDILLKAKTPISDEDTAQTLHDRLSEMGAELILKTIDRIGSSSVHPTPQDHSLATYAPLLNKKNGHIDWYKSADRLDAFIRGMTPWPGAFTFCENKRMKIFSSKPIDAQATAPPGTVLKGFEDELRIATGKGALLILEIQGASGKRMGIKDFLRGHPIKPGTQFS